MHATYLGDTPPVQVGTYGMRVPPGQTAYGARFIRYEQAGYELNPHIDIG